MVECIMLRLLSAISFITLCTLSSQARAQDEVLPQALICQFSEGFSSIYKRGQFVETTQSSDFRITYGSIDAQNGRAQMIGNAGASAVTFINSGRQLLFVERTPAGNFDFTSVIIGPMVEGSFEERLPAAHSRHVRMLDDLLVSQFTGFCEARY
jgi:hypothetical protein